MKNQITTRASTIKELINFFWQERLWWMIPFVLVLLLTGVLLLLVQSSPVAPFLYTAF